MLLKKLYEESFDAVVIAAPSVDINNLRTDNLTVNDSINELKDRVKKSCVNIVDLAERALVSYPKLNKVTTSWG